MNSEKKREFMYILERLGVNIADAKRDKQRFKELGDKSATKLTKEAKKQYNIQFDEYFLEEVRKEYDDYQSQSLEPSEEEKDECSEYQLSQGITAESPVIDEEKPLISGEKNYKPEVQQFGILATKAILYLIEKNIKPINKDIIAIIERQMDISKLSLATMETYCSRIKKIVEDGRYIKKVLSGEISVTNAYRNI